jgi:xylulokinase
MRGAFVNLSLETRRTDLVRSMVEGTALNVGWLLPAVERFTGQRIEEVAFFGGAARSPGWAQILADVLGRPVLALRDPDRAVARAMGLVALERSGLLGGDVSSLVDVGATYDPRAEHRTTYRVAQEQFVAAFDALRPINEALGSPTAGDGAQEGSTP